MSILLVSDEDADKEIQYRHIYFFMCRDFSENDKKNKEIKVYQSMEKNISYHNTLMILI